MKRNRSTFALAALFVACVTLALPHAAESRSLKVTRALGSTGLDDDASGKLRLTIRLRRGELDGKLELKLRNLGSETLHEVSVDGIGIGSFTTNRRGRGKVRFRTNPGRRDLLLGTDPRGRTITVSDGGAVLLGATVPDDSVDAADVRCCLPDDSGPECEDRTAAECLALGGVDLGTGTCMPDPCAVIDPPADEDDVRCCLPHDSGAECEDRTAAECAALNGVNLGAGVCAPNDCDGTFLPPELEDIRCCLPDDSGTECEDRTAAECIAQGGIDLGPGTCEPNPCAVEPSPEPSPDDSPSPEVSPSPDDSPSPEVSPSPDDSPSPEVSPSPDDSPSPEVSPSPDDSPSPEVSPSPDDSPSPEVSPSPDDSPSPEVSPSPDDSPSPEVSPSPDDSPSPDVSPSPDDSPSPEVSPSPDDSPSPGASPGVLTGDVRVRCERRSDRSKVSVDGSNLVPGSYVARVESGGDVVTAPAAASLGDEVEFDFDSDPDDVAAGATAIAADFIDGALQVTGVLLTPDGVVVAEATVVCEQG